MRSKSTRPTQSPAPAHSGTPNELQDFIAYCWSFYGPGELHGDTFANTLRREELLAAALLRVATVGEDFAGDSLDRECVREIVRFARNAQELTRRAMEG